MAEDDSLAIYYGKMYFLLLDFGTTTIVNTVSYYQRDVEVFNGEYLTAHKQTEGYLFKSVKTGKYFTLGSPKISSVVNKLAVPLTKKVMAAQANADRVNTSTKFTDISNVILVSDTKIDFSKLVLSKVSTTIDFENWPLIDQYYSRTYLVELNGQEYLTAMPNKWDRQRSGAELELSLVRLDIGENKVVEQRIRVINKDFNLEKLICYEVVVTYGDISAPILYMRG